MAWLEKRGQKFLLVFRLNGSRYKRLLDPKDRQEADAVAAKVDGCKCGQACEWKRYFCLPPKSHGSTLEGQGGPKESPHGDLCEFGGKIFQ